MNRAARTFTVSLVVIVGLVGSAWGTTWTGAVSSDWFDVGNWDAGIPTTAGDALFGAGPNDPVLNAPGAEADEVTIGRNAPAVLNIEAGGSLSSLGALAIGNTHDGTLNMSGGTFFVGKQLFFGDGSNGEHGQLNMTGGLLDTNTFWVGNDPGTTGHAQLDGGEVKVRAGSFRVGGSPGSGIDGLGTVDLAGGVIVTPGDVSHFSLYVNPIAVGRVTGYGQPDPGDGSRVKLIYDPVDDVTRMYGVPEPSTVIFLALGMMSLLLGRRQR